MSNSVKGNLLLNRKIGTGHFQLLHAITKLRSTTGFLKILWCFSCPLMNKSTLGTSEYALATNNLNGRKFLSFEDLCVITILTSPHERKQGETIKLNRKEQSPMTHRQPHMMTIRQVAATGILPENALRTLEKQGRLPSIKVGNVAYVNFDLLCEQFNNLGIIA